VPGQNKIPVVNSAYISKILNGPVAVINVHTDNADFFLNTGTNPAETVTIPALNRVYVADLQDGTVSVVNSTNQSVVETIVIGAPVAAIDADQVSRTLYVLDFSNGTPGTRLHVIDAETNMETANVVVGSRVQNIAINSNQNRAYITDFYEGLIVVDITDNSVIMTFPIFDLPHGIAVDPNTNIVYVTQLESDSVTVIDSTNLSVIDTLPVGDGPQWIKLDLPRNRAFVTNEGDGTVSVIDIATNTVRPTTIPVGASPLTLVVHEAEAKAYVYNLGDGTISVIDTISESILVTLHIMFSDGFDLGETRAWSATFP
jgi:YVTN family beta-propeller protein